MMKNISKIAAGLAAMSLMTAACSTFDGDGTYTELGMLNSNGTYGFEQMPTDKGGDKFAEYADNPFVKVAQQPVSTFSVDADGASYAIVRSYINNGRTVDPASVRIEEMLNYFTFDYAAPTDGQHAAINAEVGPCPWNADHLLLRLGIKGKELSADEMPLANYVFLVDVSGSMDSPDKIVLLKAGLKEMVYQMNPEDRISLITYSGQVKKLLESTPAREATKIVKAIDELYASGYTDGGTALKMAYEEAMANYDPKRNNRIILGTDGDFNFGVTGTEALTEMVEGYAKKGIYMTCMGFGFGNLNDEMMESITNHGNGTYHYIDSEEEMMKVFVNEKERFISVANDAKCQVTFNDKMVSEYRLIGYENRVIDKEDFDDDSKDAGEIGAGQTITALYEIVPADGKDFAPDDIVATFDFRYKKSLDAESIPLQVSLTAADIYNKVERSDDFYFAAGVAAFGMVLRNSPYKGEATVGMARELVDSHLGKDAHGYRKELLNMLERYKNIR